MVCWKGDLMQYFVDHLLSGDVSKIRLKHSMWYQEILFLKFFHPKVVKMKFSLAKLVANWQASKNHNPTNFFVFSTKQPVLGRFSERYMFQIFWNIHFSAYQSIPRTKMCKKLF